MSKIIPLFIAILLVILTIVGLSKNGKLKENVSKIKLPSITLSPTSQLTTQTPKAVTQNEESIGQDEINLNVNTPVNGITVNQPSIEVKGTTMPKASVFVNEKELTADNQGNFSTIINLDEGENAIIVIASDQEGNNSEKELIITYDAGTQ